MLGGAAKMEALVRKVMDAWRVEGEGSVVVAVGVEGGSVAVGVGSAGWGFVGLDSGALDSMMGR